MIDAETACSVVPIEPAVLFYARCIHVHGMRANGPRSPDLRFLSGNDREYVARYIAQSAVASNKSDPAQFPYSVNLKVYWSTVRETGDLHVVHPQLPRDTSTGQPSHHYEAQRVVTAHARTWALTLPFFFL
jgi:hypothetical protein